MREGVALGAEAYTRLRQAMDSAGFQELPLPLDALSVVDKMLSALLAKSQALSKVTKQYEHYKSVATELEEGIGPFKEETVRLLKENSGLRLEVIRIKEECEDRVRGSESIVRDLEVENTDLKYIIHRFLEKVEGKKGLGSVVGSQAMAYYGKAGVAVESVVACSACPFCVRVRNYVEFDKGRDKDPQTQDYLKITDGRMEALQIQIRRLKSSEEDLKAVVSSMSRKIADREAEIEKLRRAIRPSNLNILRGKEPDEVQKDMELTLRSKQMQIDLLQRRNINLENKLKSTILSEHEGWMLDKTKTVAERELVKDLIGYDMNGNGNKLYPSYDERLLLAKLEQLEIQLSKCCKEKAKLKSELEKSKKVIEGKAKTTLRKNGIKKSTTASTSTKDDDDDKNRVEDEEQSESDSSESSSSEEETSSSSTTQPEKRISNGKITQPRFAKPSHVIRNNLTGTGKPIADLKSAKAKVIGGGGKISKVVSNARGVSVSSASASSRVSKGDIITAVSHHVAAKRNDRDRGVPVTVAKTIGISKKYSAPGGVAVTRKTTSSNLKLNKANGNFLSREKLNNERKGDKDKKVEYYSQDESDGDQERKREGSRSKAPVTGRDKKKGGIRGDLSSRKDGRSRRKMQQGREVQKEDVFEKVSRRQQMRDEEMESAGSGSGTPRQSTSERAREMSRSQRDRSRSRSRSLQKTSDVDSKRPSGKSYEASERIKKKAARMKELEKEVSDLQSSRTSSADKGERDELRASESRRDERRGILRQDSDEDKNKKSSSFRPLGSPEVSSGSESSSDDSEEKLAEASKIQREKERKKAARLRELEQEMSNLKSSPVRSLGTDRDGNKIHKSSDRKDKSRRSFEAPERTREEAARMRELEQEINKLKSSPAAASASRKDREELSAGESPSHRVQKLQSSKSQQRERVSSSPKKSGGGSKRGNMEGSKPSQISGEQAARLQALEQEMSNLKSSTAATSKDAGEEIQGKRTGRKDKSRSFEEGPERTRDQEARIRELEQEISNLKSSAANIEDTVVRGEMSRGRKGESGSFEEASQRTTEQAARIRALEKEIVNLRSSPGSTDIVGDEIRSERSKKEELYRINELEREIRKLKKSSQDAASKDREDESQLESARKAAEAEASARSREQAAQIEELEREISGLKSSRASSMERDRVGGISRSQLSSLERKNQEYRLHELERKLTDLKKSPPPAPRAAPTEKGRRDLDRRDESRSYDEAEQRSGKEASRIQELEREIQNLKSSPAAAASKAKDGDERRSDFGRKKDDDRTVKMQAEAQGQGRMSQFPRQFSDESREVGMSGKSAPDFTRERSPFGQREKASSSFTTPPGDDGVDLRRGQNPQPRFEDSQRSRMQAARIQELEREIMNLKSSLTAMDREKEDLRVELERKGGTGSFESYQRSRMQTGRITELEREIVNLKSSLTSMGREKTELQDELERKDERLGGMRQDNEALKAEASRLRLQLSSLEREIAVLRQSAMEQAREVSNLTQRDRFSSSLKAPEPSSSKGPGGLKGYEDPQRGQRMTMMGMGTQTGRMQELEREINYLKSSLSAIDKDRDELRVELDRKDERLARMRKECEGHLAEASKLKNQLRNMEMELGVSRQTGIMESSRDVSSTRLGTRDRYPGASQMGPVGANLESFEASQRARMQGARIQELEREISYLKASITSMDRNADELRVEMDRKDEKLARMRQECEVHLAENSKLTLQLRNKEVEVGLSGQSASEVAREVTHYKHEVEMLRRDLESVAKERDEALRDCRKLAGAVSKEEIERRSLHSELDKTSKEADELRKQVHQYIEEVRRIEELLLQKEEEMESLIEHYRALSLEKSTLETQRSSLELKASSIREDVREAVDANIILKNQLLSANSLVASYEEQLEELSMRISTLENQLATSAHKEKTAESDAKAARDLIFTLETKMDKLKLDLASAESVKHKLEAETGHQKSQIEILEDQLKQEIERRKKLEDVMGAAREKEFTVERTTQELAQDKSRLAERLQSLQTRTESLTDEVAKYRLRSMELQNELERTKRQLQSEKAEREVALSELRRVQDQLNNTSTSRLLSAAMGGSSPGMVGQTSATSGLPFSPLSDSYLDSAPLGRPRGDWAAIRNNKMKDL